MDIPYTPGIVQASTIQSTVWTPIHPLHGNLADLDPARMHAIAGHPDLVIAVLGDQDRHYVVSERLCPHRPRGGKRADLTTFGKIDSASGEMTCRHIMYCWELTTGAAGGDSENLKVLPTKLENSTLLVLLPGSDA